MNLPQFIRVMLFVLSKRWGCRSVLRFRDSVSCKIISPQGGGESNTRSRKSVGKSQSFAGLFCRASAGIFVQEERVDGLKARYGIVGYTECIAKTAAFIMFDTFDNFRLRRLFS